MQASIFLSFCCKFLLLDVRLRGDEEILWVLSLLCCDKRCLRQLSVEDIKYAEARKMTGKQNYFLEVLHQQSRLSESGVYETEFFVRGKGICREACVGGAVASWLVRSTPERAVRVRALAGDSVLCSWARHFTLTVPLSTQVYKWVPAICWGNLTKLRGSDLRWTSIPSRGSRNTSSRLMLQKPG